MHYHRYDTMTADELRRFVDSHHEREFQIIDVRQPGEYTQGHIPGARLLPLPAIEETLSDLPEDRALIFYCRSGGRSAAAAGLVRAAEHTEFPVYHLDGGLMAWDGRQLKNMPRVAIVVGAGGYRDKLWEAMNLEKGAWRYYQRAREAGSESAVADTFGPLVDAEFAHARAIHSLWMKETADPKPFDDVFETLTGDVLEGGQTVTDAIADLSTAAQGPTPLALVELALVIEVEAYDLYRNLEDLTDDPEQKSVYLALAQAEKAHMRHLIASIERWVQ